MTETTKDFYTDAKRRGRIARIMLIIVGIGIALGVVSLMMLEKKKKEVAIAASTASAQAWKLAGPPCPTATTAEFAHHAERAKKVFDFNGDVYARRGGHVDCNLTVVKGVKDPVPVCQFTSPQAISVTTKKGTYYFVPGVGHPATISVANEAAACVMASNFNGT